MNDHATTTAPEREMPSSSRRKHRPTAITAGCLMLAGVFAATVPLPNRAKAAEPKEDGVICTEGPNQVLTARDGYVLTPDGNSIYMWSYSAGNAAFQYPGPVICVTEGDNVTITLKNHLPAPTSLVFPAIPGVKKDGALALPKAPDIAHGDLTPSVPAGGSATYTFTADHAGTYLYESGTSPETQDQMGLVGALIVRPVGHPDWVYSSTGALDSVSTQFKPDREFIHILTEVDPDLHQCFESAMRDATSAKNPGEVFNSGCTLDGSGTPTFAYDMTTYKPRYFMINGRSFPDTIAPNNSERLPGQPYSALVHVRPRGDEFTGHDAAPALVRYLNAGPVSYPFHPHVENEQVVGQDGRKVVAADGSDITQDLFSVVVAPGSTIDAFFSWKDAEAWYPTTNEIGVPVPQQQERKDGEFWSGSPYLGFKTPSKATATSFNECGEYYNVAHSHALFQATNYGASMGGMLTMIRIDPPGGC